MKKLLFVFVAAGLAACGSGQSEEELLTSNTSTEEAVGESAAALGTPPADPATGGVVPRPSRGINGSRPPRVTVEPQPTLVCISKTTAACTTGSGGIGAVCGPSALCNTDLACVAGVCRARSTLNGTCALNVECGAYQGTALVCIQGSCKFKSPDTGACDEAADCAGSAAGPSQCVANVCRPLGDIGAPCQSPLHCKATSSTGQPLTCMIPSGATVGTCQVLSGPGGGCVDETQCNQSTAPRCIPTTPNRTCAVSGATGARCDDKPDCNQAIGAAGQECINNTCQLKGSAGTSCSLNSNCINGLVCINGTCIGQSGTGGACDEIADCTQTQPQGCVSGVCRLSGVLNGPCGAGGFCGSSATCATSSNPSGVLFCIAGTCSCPASGTCFTNSNCGPTPTGQQQVCVPRVAPAIGNVCQPVNTSTGGCCDEKADCRPTGGSTCSSAVHTLGCNAGGQCIVGKNQGQICASSEECNGSLVCKINTLIPGRNYTTCEF